MLCLVAVVLFGVSRGAALGPGYTTVVFAENFESGSLSAWNGLLGNGSATVQGPAAHGGSYGLRLSNGPGEFQVLVKSLPNPVMDSSVTFWVRIASGSGYQTLAQARDGSSSLHMWGLGYDAGARGLWFYTYSDSGSGALFTGGNTLPADTWVKVEVQYTATVTGGGAQLYLNDQTQADWGVRGNFTRSADLQRLQLWNDGPNAVDIDDLTIATPAGAATPPGAPTGVSGVPGNGSVALSWNAPASDGGSSITGYRITPRIGGTAQSPILTGSSATNHTVNGLANGTAYTFTVEALNAVGAGPPSAPSAPVTPTDGSTVPGAPSGVTGVAGDRSVVLSWSAPSSNGGSAITGYRITPFIGGTAQTAVSTSSAATSHEVTGLTNGTAYTFRVAARNAVGTGADSAPSSPATPRARYTNVIFGESFESGNLSAWNGAPGTGTTTVSGAAAYAGSYGLRMSNAAGEYSFAAKVLSAPVRESATSFRVRISASAGFQSVAQARDNSSGVHMWELYYDGGRRGFVLLAYRASGSSEIFTGVDSVPPNTWHNVEVQYAATATGGARLYVNGESRDDWGASGNFTRSADLQRFQLWNDAPNTTDFDNVRVLTPLPPGATVPTAPTGLSALSRDSAVALRWTAPTSDGSSPINGYRITPWIGTQAQTPVVVDFPVTDHTVTGLANGTTYTFTVAAINGAGTGPDSSASAAVTPAVATLPGAPSNVTGAPRDGAVLLSWTPPASDGGTSITSYLITPYRSGLAEPAFVTGSGASSYSVTGLTNNTPYTFTVAATNAVGTSPNSAASGPITPREALSEYTNVVFSDGFESGTLGGWNGSTGTGTSSVVSTASRTGAYGMRLTTLESQYVLVQKLLSAPLADSAITMWVRPGGASGISTAAQARDAASSANFWELAYDATRRGFIFYAFSSTGSTELFTGANTVDPNTWTKVVVQFIASPSGGAQLYLNGQTKANWGVTGNYTRSTGLQRLQLWNDGHLTIDFDDVAMATLSPPGTIPPSSPLGVSGSALDRAVSLNWNAPTSDGGSAVTGYRITPYQNGSPMAPILTGSSATNFRVAGLTNGVPYTFTVAGINSAGTGTDSVSSAPVTPAPAPPPGQPTGVTGTPGNNSVALSWTAPTSDGGSPITSYRITPRINGVGQTPINTGSTATTRTITGLTNGTAYTFTVAATNASGTGSDSSPSAPITPAAPTAPGAPTGLVGSPRDRGVALTWSAPAFDGGSAVTSYRIVPYIGGTAQTPVTTGSSATGHTVTGLTNGTAYTFTVAAINAVGTGSASSPSGSVTPAVPPANPIVLENQNAGTTSWEFTLDRKAENHEIEGYASLTSVNKGGSIDLMVSLSSAAQFDLDIYRMGWYPQGTNPDGSSCAPSCGGRLMRHVGPLSGARQATCAQIATPNHADFGMTECSWTPSYTLAVPTNWTTGNYIVKVTRRDTGRENYLTFVVRDDSSTSPIVYSMDVTTWQAYNFWGGSGNNNIGYDLYSRFNDVSGDNIGSRAYTVSFDRPYAGEGSTDGAGLFFNWDYPMVRFLESKGYDITYVTNVDMERNPNLLVGHRAFVNTGHDEYYSDGMMSTLQNGINAGANLALFSANNFYFRTTWAANSSGSEYRRIHCDKNGLPNSTTYQYRHMTPARPENILGGVMLQGIARDRPFRVSDSSHWIYAGTGLRNYNPSDGVITSGPLQNSLPGIVGYEFDARASTSPSLSTYASFEPPTTTTVAHSLVPASDGNATNVYHDATVYTAPSGATVWSAGTIQWSWGVDRGYNSGFCGCAQNYVNAATQRITQNIIDRFIGP